jgi:hypothetical protein
MAVIYISSTYKDLVEERKAAAKAIRLLRHTHLAMEDYVASDKRPVDQCLEDVRDCDLYVGIFAWRYGFIPNGYDKSITHLEYEEARKNNIPCLIFLLKEKAPGDLSPGDEDRKNIEKLREKLEKDHTVSFFLNAPDLSTKVTAAISLKLSPPSPKKTRQGRLASKLCDRVRQVKSFSEFFESNWEKFPRRPQFYFIHGDENAAHESFLDRLMGTCLKEFAEKEWGTEHATIKLEKVKWSEEGKQTEQQELLKFNLKNKFCSWGRGPCSTAVDLSQLPSMEKRPLVLIKHNIYSSRWDKHTVPLITWYIKKYWSNLEDYEDIPLFLIFFNVIYRESKETGLKHIFSRRKSYSKEDIKKQLELVCKTSGATCPCLMLEELTQVEIEDVLDWFEEQEIYEDYFERKERANIIFRNTGEHVVKYKSMAKVEKELKKIVEEQHKKEDI